VRLFDDCATALFNQHAPMKVRKLRIRQTPPWWNSNLFHQKRLSRRQEKQRRHSGLEIHKQVYTEQERLYNTHLLILIRYYLRDTLSDLAPSSIKMWNILNQALGHDRKLKLPKDRDPIELASEFNHFFLPKVEQLCNTIHSGCTSSLALLPNFPVNADTLSNFSTVTTSKIMRILKMSPRKSCFFDVFPSWLFFKCISSLHWGTFLNFLILSEFIYNFSYVTFGAEHECCFSGSRQVFANKSNFNFSIFWCQKIFQKLEK
jgi:hypothetical protein